MNFFTKNPHLKKIFFFLFFLGAGGGGGVDGVGGLE